MCRLYGFRANEPTKVECSLVYAQNALMVQSREDQRGVSHADGWGVGTFDQGLPRVRKEASAAFEGLEFQDSAARVYSTTVVAHVRRATVGLVSRENAHPFQHGSWMFAHNGTVAGYDRLADALREESGEYAILRRGTTDSEVVFHWLLARITKAGMPPCRPAADSRLLVETFRRALADLAERCEKEAPGKARLNMILTDGRNLVASRYRNGLHRLRRVGIHDCEICGIPHVHHQEGRPYVAAVLASEPITAEAWHEVPDFSLVHVSPEVGVEVQAL